MTSCTSSRQVTSERYCGWASIAVRVAGAAEVVDRLEQRRDPDRAGRPVLRRRVEEPDLLEQDGDLEDVTHRLAHADDVVRNGVAAEPAHRVRGGGEDVELLAGQLGQFGVRPDQRTAQPQFPGQQFDPLLLGHRRVVVAHAGPGQQFGEDLLVHRGVLPKVQPAQVEAEDVDRLAQPQQPVVGQFGRAVAASDSSTTSRSARSSRGEAYGSRSACGGGPATAPRMPWAVAHSRAEIPFRARR